MGVYEIFTFVHPNRLPLSCQRSLWKTLRTIDQVDDFSDLRISYIPKLFERTEERRQRLMKNYYFLCECPKCLDVIGDQTKSSIKCPGKN